MDTLGSNELLRVLVVGHTGVGKTLFLQRLYRSTVCNKEKGLQARGHTVGFSVEVINSHREGRLGSSNHVGGSEVHVAFVEVGGNRNFGRSGFFPLSLFTFHGVIFLYDRHSVESATDLVYWYECLKSYGIVGAGGIAKVLLVETTHIPSTDGPSCATLMLPDEFAGCYLQESMKKTSALRGRVLDCVQRLLRRFSGINRLSVSDFQKKQQPLRQRVSVLLHQAISAVENLLLFIMAVTLFGPGQKSVPFFTSSVSCALGTIENDAGGTRTLRECPLYDQALFEAMALDEVLSFLESLRSA